MRFLDVSQIRSRFDEPVITRDGLRLSADIYRPATRGSFPALITRTPYDNNRMAIVTRRPAVAASPTDQFKRLAAQGFVVVACDVRGRGDSDGDFTPFVNEVGDGVDTIDWVRSLNECDGRIGLFGSGYAGFAALAAASATAVDAVAVLSPFGAAGTPFQNGALRLEWLFWMHLVSGRTPQPVDLPSWDAIFRHRPILAMPEALGRDRLPWADWLEQGPDFPAGDIISSAASTAAVMVITGWWDSGIAPSLDYWHQLRSLVDGERRHALMVGPWDAHSVRRPNHSTGGIAWGPTAIVDPDELLIDWFDAHLRNGTSPQRGANVFVTGRNEWAALDPAEPPKTSSRFWLGSRGRANTRRGDGALRLLPPGEDQVPDTFVHNPHEPVPWQPQAGSFSRSRPTSLSLNSAFATARDDVLVYRSDPFERPKVICGSPLATLWVDTEALDADWVVVLEDLFPGGSQSVSLAHGVVRSRALNLDFGRADRPTKVEIQLTPIVHELLTGHALQMTIASSLWPLYAVNLGGEDYLHDSEPRISEHTVFHDKSFPSTLDVPTVIRS